MGKRNLKAELQEDLKVNYENKDSGGMQGAQYLNIKGDNCSIIKLKKGKNAIDIIPFVRGTDLFKGKAKGSVASMIDIYVHTYFNQSYDKCICMRRTYNEPCPICEERTLLKGMEEPESKDERKKLEKRIKDLNPKQRVIANAVNLREDEEDENNGQIQILDESYFLFAKPLLEEACADDEGGPVNYAYPDGGKEIHIRGGMKKMKIGKPFLEFQKFDFEDRDEEYDEDIVEYEYEDDVFEHGAFPLDSLLIIPTYEEVKAMLADGVMTSDDEEEEDEAPTPKKKGHKGKKVSKPEPEEEDDEEEEDEAPTPKKKGHKGKKVEESEEPEEEKGTETECPHGHTFGVDNMEKDECVMCKKKTPSTFRDCVMAEYAN